MTQAAEPKGPFEGPAGLAIVVLAVATGAFLLEQLTRPPADGQATPPIPMPTLAAEGWINTGQPYGPSTADLRGRYVVIDFWATDCYACLKSMPSLVRLYKEWRNEGVEFIGLTSEPTPKLGVIQQTIDRYDGLDWPIGYGAGMTQLKLEVRAFPTFVLFDPEGRSVWRGHRVDSLAAELAKRL